MDHSPVVYTCLLTVVYQLKCVIYTSAHAEYLGYTSPKPKHLLTITKKLANGTEYFHLLTLISSSWIDIGEKMDIPSDVLKSLKENYMNDVRCMRKIFFNHWYPKPPKGYPISWQGLYNLLSDVGRMVDANKFFDFLTGMLIEHFCISSLKCSISWVERAWCI